MHNFQTASFILIGSFLALLILRVPITFTLFASSVVTAVYLKIPLMSIVQRMVSGVNTFRRNDEPRRNFAPTDSVF